MKKSLSIILLSMFLVFSLFSIVGAQEVKDPDTFVYAAYGDRNTLDPHYCYDTSSGEAINQVYENLIMYKGESVTEFEPMLSTVVPSAENGLISEDGKEYTFILREGIKFHNGNDLTPEDVKYSVIRGLIFDRSGGPMWMMYEPLFGVAGLADITTEVVGVEDPSKLTAEQSAKVYQKLEECISIDGNEITFHLANPYPPFLNILAHNSAWSSIMDKEWCIENNCWDGKPTTIAKYYNPERQSDPVYDKMNGTGPFELTEWVPKDHIIFSRNDNYWREPANFETIIIKKVDENSTRRLMLKRGDADMVHVDNMMLDQYKGMDGVTIDEGLPALSSTNAIMNWEIDVKGNKDVGSGKLDGKGIPPKFFADPDIRKAFSHCINYDAFFTEVTKGRTTRARGPIIDPLLGYDKDSYVRELDLEKAEEHFRKAFNGEIWEKGFELTINYNTGNQQRKVCADMIKQYVESINPKFKVHIRDIQWSSFLDKLIAGQFTLGFSGWLADYPDPHNWVVPYAASYGSYSGFNGDAYIEYAEENIDPLIEKGIYETDPVKREEIYKEIQQKCMEDATMIWIYQATDNSVRRDWVKGYYYNACRSGEYFYAYDK